MRVLQRQADVTTLDRMLADLSYPAACTAIVRHADTVYTAVDQVETNEGLATAINAAAQGLPFLHVSTCYVFEGSGSAQLAPEERAAPINTYGRSKFAGEQGMVAAAGMR